MGAMVRFNEGSDSTSITCDFTGTEFGVRWQAQRDTALDSTITVSQVSTKAPSPLRSAGALQNNLSGGIPSLPVGVSVPCSRPLHGLHFLCSLIPSDKSLGYSHRVRFTDSLISRISHAGSECGNPTGPKKWPARDWHRFPRRGAAPPQCLHPRPIKHPEEIQGD